MNYHLVFKYEKMNPIYVCGTDEFGNPLHTIDESKAYKFYDIVAAMKFHKLGYGIATKVSK